MKAGRSYLLSLTTAAALSLCAGALIDAWTAADGPERSTLQARIEAPRVIRIVLASGSFAKSSPTVLSREIPAARERPLPAPEAAAAEAVPAGRDLHEEKRQPFAFIEEPVAPATAAAKPAAAAGTRPGGRASPPMPLGELRPVYPRSARRRGLEGSARIRVVVGADGTALGAELLVSSGHDSLDQAALSAVLTAGYRPAEADGRGIQGELVVPVRFMLTEP